MKLFFNYSIDCVLPPDERFGGPPSWEFAETSTRSFVDVMSEVGLRQAATLFIYPDVARKQGLLFRQLADAGIETALHLNGLRYSRMKQPAWLGWLPYAEQRDAIRMAKTDPISEPRTRVAASYIIVAVLATDDPPVCPLIDLPDITL